MRDQSQSGAPHKSWRRLPDRHSLFIFGLRLCWIAVILWLELGPFNHVLSSCRWPAAHPHTKDDSDPRITNILLIADPQILDSHSYPDRSPLLSRLTQFIVDFNLRKSWRLVALKLRPHVVVFLGDMMDGGRGDMGDVEYERYYKRFINIFKVPYYPMPVYYLPGNHDTGLGSSLSFSPNATSRYKSHFGPLNKRLSIANHSVLLIDAPGLVEEDRERVRHGYDFGGAGEAGKGGWSAMPGGTVEFVRRYAAKKYDQPTVLLTHIPLSRPDGMDCGPLREKGTIRRGAGLGYENTLSAEASSFLLQNTRPSIIFSGDDHDYCSISHPMPPHPSSPKTHKQLSCPEITIKSISMAMGINRPGFQLLSLVAEPSYQQQLHAPCFLPDQLGIYVWGYASLAVVSLVLVFVANIFRVRREEVGRGRVRSGTPSAAEAAIGLVTLKAEKPRVAGARRGTLEVEGRTTRGRRFSASGDGTESLDEREGEGFVNNVLGNGNGNGAPYAQQFLPVPSQHPRRDRAFSWTFVLGNRRRRISIPSVLGMGRSLLLSLYGCGESQCSRRQHPIRHGGVRNGDKDGEPKGLVRGFVSDVRSVAWAPVGVFLGIAWWMFNW